MRKLIPLFLSLIIPMPALATATCTTTKEPKACREIPGCTWGGKLGHQTCQPCGETYYGKGDGTSQNQCVLCNKLSGTVDGKTITGYWDASKEGSAKHECYADCDAKLKTINADGSTGKWMLGNNEHTIAYGTTDEKKMCKFACYTGNDDYNTCVSYYHPWNFQTQKPDMTVCQPSWLFMGSPNEIQNNPYKPSNGQSSTDFCQNAKTGIYMVLQSSGTDITCSAQSCQDGFHLESVQDIVDAELPTGDADKYYCQSDTLNISNENLFQTCESNTRKCSDHFHTTSCKVTIDGTEYTGTVGGNAEWNGNNAYLTDKCTCTVSTSVTEGTYEHVCKRSTTSNTWDGTNCETTIESCNPGYCVNDKTQRCATAKRGYYSDGRDNGLECRKCPAGKTTETIGSTNAGACSYSPQTQFCDSVGCFNLNYTSLQ